MLVKSVDFLVQLWLVLGRVAEGAGVVKSGEKEAQERRYCSLTLPERKL